MNRGTFIVFEGIDGSGKTTQLARLGDALERAGHAVVRTREPWEGSEAGRRIRENARAGRAMAPEQELAWFREQRRDHLREVVVPALAAGRIVLCDRYYLSTVAYQGARGLDASSILRESEAEMVQPDLVLLIELAPEQGLARVAERGGPHEPEFEERAFQERVAAQFARIDRPYLFRVDGAGGEDTVAAAVAAAVTERLGFM